MAVSAGKVSYISLAERQKDGRGTCKEGMDAGDSDALAV